MDKTTVLTHEFPNGRKFTGTMDELKAVATALGQPLDITPRGFYNSATEGLVEIKTMHAHHIRRAVLKATTDYMKKVFASKDTNTEFLKKYGDMVADPVIEDLLSDLVRRGDKLEGEEPTVKVATATKVSTKKKASATSKKS